MTSRWDVIPNLPSDLQPVAENLYENVVEAVETFSALPERVLNTLSYLGKARGDPEALQRGETLIRVGVKSEITQAKTQLQAALDGFNQRGA